jgi:hypothetical protein
MWICGDRLGTQRALHVHGINKKFSWIRASNKYFPCIRARLEPCIEEWFIRKRVVLQGSRSGRSDRFVNQNQVSHSGREDTRSPLRNEASLDSHGLWALIINCNCKGSAHKSSHPVHNPLYSSRNPPIHDILVLEVLGFDRLDRIIRMKKLCHYTISHAAMNSWQLETTWSLHWSEDWIV